MDLVAIKSDIAFRAVFGRECEKCKQALIALLNDVLGLKIKTLSYANPLNYQSYENDKKSEMDIEIITDQGERIDIEIQLLWMRGFENRMVYYGSKLINENLESGEDYDYLEMKKCKVLSIVDFTLFKHNQRVKNVFRFKETNDNYELTDILEIIFLEMGKIDERKPQKDMDVVEQWLYFLKYVDDKEKQKQIQEIIEGSEGINMAMEILREVSADEQLRTRIRFQEKAERDQKARMYTARMEGLEEGIAEGEKKGLAKGIAKGIAEGEKKGLAEGIAEGEKKGLAKGITEGEKKGKLMVARNLLDILDDEAIALKAGLDTEEVSALRNEALLD